MIAAIGAPADTVAMNDDPAFDPSAMNDRELIATYEMTEGDPDDPRSEALLREIERRGLDI